MGLTLFNLENSRAFRVHWLACELNVPLTTRNYARIEGKKAVPELAKDSGYKLGKSPCLVEDATDGGEPLRVVESANCMIYLVERYGGADNVLLPAAPRFAQRTRVIGWLDFAETIMTHALALVYPAWFKRPQDEEAVLNIQEKASANVQKDLDEIETALEGLGGPYVCGARFTAADIALAFSCEYVLTKQLGTQGRTWPRIEAWLRTIEAREAYQKALREGPKYDFCLLKSGGGQL